MFKSIFKFLTGSKQEKSESIVEKKISVPNYHKYLVDMGAEHGWKVIDWQENIGLLSFTNAGMRINIYTTKMTVGTCLTHPKKGSTQLFRRHVTTEQMKKIFANPRIHTGKGYY